MKGFNATKERGDGAEYAPASKWEFCKYLRSLLQLQVVSTYRATGTTAHVRTFKLFQQIQVLRNYLHTKYAPTTHYSGVSEKHAKLIRKVHTAMVEKPIDPKAPSPIDLAV